MEFFNRAICANSLFCLSPDNNDLIHVQKAEFGPGLRSGQVPARKEIGSPPKARNDKLVRSHLVATKIRIPCNLLSACDLDWHLEDRSSGKLLFWKTIVDEISKLTLSCL